MTTTIAKVIGEPSDYWICPECGCLNWYENEECGDGYGMSCNAESPLIGEEPCPTDYDSDDDFEEAFGEYGANQEIVYANMENEVLKYIQNEIDFYMEEYDYTENECDNIEINC